MKKGTKIAIGVGSALAASAATAGILYVKNKKKNKSDIYVFDFILCE